MSGVTTLDPLNDYSLIINRLYPCKYCAGKEIEIDVRGDKFLGTKSFRFTHRCPPNIYQGYWYDTIDETIQEWNEYNAPREERIGGFLTANPCRYCGNNDLWLEELTEFGAYFGKHDSCNADPVIDFMTTGYKTPEEVLDAWNLANPLPESLAPEKPPLTPEELPALPFALRRGKRLIEYTKQAIDLEMVEIEVGVREMRSYKDGKLITQKEESISLRAAGSRSDCPKKPISATFGV